MWYVDGGVRAGKLGCNGRGWRGGENCGDVGGRLLMMHELWCWEDGRGSIAGLTALDGLTSVSLGSTPTQLGSLPQAPVALLWVPGPGAVGTRYQGTCWLGGVPRRQPKLLT